MPLASVLLIEDDSFSRITLSEILNQRGFNLVGAVDNAEEALMLQKLHKPEVLVTDLDLGAGPNGLDIARAMRQKNLNLGVIFLTSYSDPRLADTRPEDLPEGAVYFTKSKLNDMSTFITAILQVKHSPINKSRRKKIDVSALTDIQIEILKMVSEGKTTSAIAKERNVTEKSVEATISRIYDLLGLDRSKEMNPRIQLTRAYFALTGKRPPGE